MHLNIDSLQFIRVLHAHLGSPGDLRTRISIALRASPGHHTLHEDEIPSEVERIFKILTTPDGELARDWPERAGTL